MTFPFCFSSFLFLSPQLFHRSKNQVRNRRTLSRRQIHRHRQDHEVQCTHHRHSLVSKINRKNNQNNNKKNQTFLSFICSSFCGQTEITSIRFFRSLSSSKADMSRSSNGSSTSGHFTQHSPSPVYGDSSLISPNKRLHRRYLWGYKPSL